MSTDKIQYKYGGNGKVLIDKKKSLATKTLKNIRNEESKNRFIKELNLLNEIAVKKIENVVEIVEVDIENLKIVMPLYDGDLTMIYNYTIGNVSRTIELLLPIIKALKHLSELDTPIFHRDLKPANILVKKTLNSYKLFIADFGCAYLKEEFSPRETPDFRAVGAQHFRAPEYDYGRVEEINEKGDIFSIGKVFWCMLNGVYGEIFPFTLWFPNEYNIENRFPQSPLIVKANLIIASCVDIDSEKRPNYNSLIKIIENTLSDVDLNKNDNTIELKAKKFEAIRKVKEIEIKALTKNMLEIFYQDMNECIFEIEKTYNDFELVSHLKKDFSNVFAGRSSSINHKVNNDQESYIFSTSQRNIYISMNYHSSYGNRILDADIELPHISFDYNITSTKKSNNVNIYYSKKVLYIKNENTTEIYSKLELLKFLNKLVDDYISVEI